ncbi:MAG: hypothetical protein HXY34_07725 [Candidatus Thorarchaeota archaeon]|nr:hypothetical protein [Candidatus Thorarchaeota archaeon]
MNARWSVTLAVLLLLSLANHCGPSPSPTDRHLRAQDTLRPEISEWGLTGDAAGGLAFTTWANVTDVGGSGIRNVTLLITSSGGSSSQHSMAFNGTLFEVTVPPLQFNQTHELRIRAFDMANNSATSYARTVDRRPTSKPTVDPSATMPYVVTSSFVLSVLVSLVATLYHRRKRHSTHLNSPSACILLLCI